MRGVLKDLVDSGLVFHAGRGQSSALAHYVQSLVVLRDRPEADALAQRLRDQPPWSPPPLPAADAATDAP